MPPVVEPSDVQLRVRRSRLLGTGHYLPARIVTNDELAQKIETSDAWITERTGIRRRRVAAPEEVTSDMAAQAAASALARAGLSPDDLDMIVVGTVTPDLPMPATAVYLQRKLGIKRNIPAFDISAACAGFVYGLSIADQYVRSGAATNVLVVGVELLSRILNWDDRTTCVLFGDGAGAAIVGPAEGSHPGILSTKLFSDGSLAEALLIPAGGSREPVTAEGLVAKRNKVHMQGKDVFKAAVKYLASACESALEVAGIAANEIDWVVAHQANLRILAQVSERIGIGMDRFVINIEDVGNTSSASIPIALDQALRDGRIRPGQTVLVCALGAGISWGTGVIRI